METTAFGKTKRGVVNGSESSRISAIIIAKNEEMMIANCIDTLRWCDEIIVIDDHSSDRTPELAQQAGAIVLKNEGKTFASARNTGKDAANGQWLFYVDADERVTPALMRAIRSVLHDQESAVAYQIPRRNIHYGSWLQYGGWGTDAVVRLFRKSALKAWRGDIHEHAEIAGTEKRLSEELIHLTHRSVKDGLEKSIHWTAIEARLLFESGHKPIGMFRLLSIPIRSFFYRMIRLRAFKDGAPGWIEAMVQAMNRFLVYAQLWELQQKPTIPEQYAKYEQDIAKLWQRR